MSTQTESYTRLHLHQHWLAWWLFDLICVFSAISLVFLALSWVTRVPDIWGFRGDAVILALTFGSIGLLLARRHTKNPIGWLLLAAGLVNALVEFCIEYATYALLTKPSVLPYGTLAAWTASWLWVVAIAMLIYSFLLFPTGHLPSVRWRPVAWFIVGAFALMTFSFMIRPGPLQFAPYLDNPFTVPVAYGVLRPISAVNAGAILLIGLSVILRLRRAGGVERQQLKWFAYAATLMTIIGMISSLVDAAGLTGTNPKSFQYFTVAIWIAISFAIAFAILRYRLWDIDIIINRTLVYGALTASVVGLYVLIVGGLGTVLQTQNNLPVIVIAILLIAFCFQPLRRRLQNIANRFVPVPQATSPLEPREDKIIIPESPARMTLHGRWFVLAHAAWFVCAILTAIVLFGTLPIYYSHYVQPIRSDQYSLGQFNLPFQVLVGLSDLVSSFISSALAVLLFWRKPNDRMALFASFFFLYTSIAWSYSLDYFLTAYFGASSTHELWSDLSIPLTILLFCIFPDGHFVPRWTRWLFIISILTSLSIFAGDEGRFISDPVTYPLFFVVTYAQVYRYRRVSSYAERQQTKWVVFGLVVSLALALVASLIYKRLSPPLINIIPLMLAIAVLRSRLWDIDLIMNRTLVYGALTVGIVALYILLVGTLSLLSQTTGNLLISLLATGLIAFLFQPLRERLQRGVNRLVYGERDDPYAALSRLGRRLEASLAQEAVLPTVVTTVRDVLKLPYVAIYLPEDASGYKIVTESASPSLRSENGRIRVPGMEREGLCMPLIHQGETLGYMVLGPRAPNEAFNSRDLRLLDDLAPQVGVAVHAVRLTADLQRSRERLVLAREEERRRLRRDLHDGLGPQLAGLTLKLETARNRLTDDPLADSLLADLAKRTQDATADIRRLVYELRPPTLDELGLVSALREGASQYNQQGMNGMCITIDAPDNLPALPAAVEVAVYRITQEALTNVVRHAEAHTCKVRLGLDEQMNLLYLEIQDDGRGVSSTRRAGVGLHSMRERAEELGGTWTIESIPTGGTRILAKFPCRLPDSPLSIISEET